MRQQYDEAYPDDAQSTASQPVLDFLNTGALPTLERTASLSHIFDMPLNSAATTKAPGAPAQAPPVRSATFSFQSKGFKKSDTS